MADAKNTLIIVSDGTGETASQMIKAAMVQFSQHAAVFKRHKNIRTLEQINAICEDAQESKALLIFTLVSPPLRTVLIQNCREKQIPCVDLIGPLLTGLAGFFGVEPKLTAGLLRIVDEKYFRRIEAMEYTIAHDDGKDVTGLEKADLVILGISRTSKTPLSMYLSHHGWKVANIPLIRGFDFPKELASLDARRIVALTIDAEDLTLIRRARLERLGQRNGGDYAEPSRVNEEIEYAAEIFRKNRKWAVFNVTGKALEETAAEIIRLMASRKLLPPDEFEDTAQSGLPMIDSNVKKLFP